MADSTQSSPATQSSRENRGRGRRRNSQNRNNHPATNIVTPGPQSPPQAPRYPSAYGRHAGRRPQWDQLNREPLSPPPIAQFQNNFNIHHRGNRNGLGFRPPRNQRNGSSGELSVAALQEFLDNGQDRICASEVERQTFLTQLASQDGLQKVRQLLETDYSKTYSVLKPTFTTHCVAFLRILSNEIVLTALSLEQQIRTIYSVVYGFNGERAIPFFEKTVECLTALKPDDESTVCMDHDSWVDALYMVVATFLHTLRSNHNAILQDGIQKVGATILKVALADDFPAADEVKFSLDENISKIQTFLSTGAEIPTGESRFKKRSSRRQEGEEEIVDFPGQLSTSGPRHDNDHELIANISILPTVSEILCYDRSEFLPTKLAYTVADQHHQYGIQRLVDIQFRLLREDTSGQLRDSSRFVIQHWEEMIAPVLSASDWQAKRKLIRDGCSTPMRLYSNVFIQKLSFETKRGLEAVIEFEQPHAAKRLNQFKRQQWWRKSTELRENKALVALIEKTNEGANIVFLVVSKRVLISDAELARQTAAQSHSQDQTAQEAPPAPEVEEPVPIEDLSTDQNRAAITLYLTTLGNPAEQAGLIRLATKYRGLNPGQHGGLLMIEFPAVVYKNYEGILRCLKIIHQNPADIPFSKWLEPHITGTGYPTNDLTSDATGAINLPPPKYLRNYVSYIDLAPCCDQNPTESQTTFPLFYRDDEKRLTEDLARRSTLDHGQAKAMISAFKNEVALIQGPPGCGKSYIGVKMVHTLLKNRDRLDLGPILCICYTNHALDQFLNELLKLGISNIARLGSPSALPQIEALSLENRKRAGGKVQIRGLGARIAEIRTTLNGLHFEISFICTELEGDSLNTVTKYITKKFPAKLQDIVVGATNYGYEQDKKDPSEAVHQWMQCPGLSFEECDDPIDQLLMQSVWSMTIAQRRTLYQFWYECAVEQLTLKLQSLLKAFGETKKQYTGVYLEADRACLRQVDIIGITTVGLVNNADLVRTLPCKVMVCEEAGEVLESHILTALLPSLQHMILIGDHLQLRPKISNLQLSKEWFRGRSDTSIFNLDESLFERLAHSKLKIQSDSEGEQTDETLVEFPVAQLDIQRRMHPDIANLVRTTLYPELYDHEITKHYPQITGIKRRLFWLDHQNYEDPSDPNDAMGLSKTNTWEARTVVSLIAYLTRQGTYKSGEIAVLTPYISQLRLLMEMFENIVDFDVSERDLEELDQRLEDTEKKPSTVKKSKVIDRLRLATVDNFQGEEATIVIISLVRSNERKNCGFLKTPNRINVLLSRAKHGMYIIGDASTSVYVPMWRRVMTLLEENGNLGPKLQLHCARHPSKKTFVGCPEDFELYCPEGGCSESCNLRLKCGHTCEYRCHSKVIHESVFCLKPCTKPRDCGHPCIKACKEPCGNCTHVLRDVPLPCGHTAPRLQCYLTANLSRHTCTQAVTKSLNCGHEIQVPCFSQNDTRIKMHCTHKCGSRLPCGHMCYGLCRECTTSGKHKACTTPCEKEYKLCRHKCSKVCHEGESCPPCSKPCEIKCKHGSCPNPCGEACIPCAETCGWECEHEEAKCNMPCSVPCDKLPCNKRCDKPLKRCKHQCPSICGEECPSSKYCQECAGAKILNMRVNLITLEQYKEIKLDEDPIILLSCGHIYTVSSLDGHLELKKHYGESTGPRQLQLTSETLKGCPDCRHPLRDINRYNKVFKTLLLSELTRRFVNRSTEEYAKLMEDLRTMQSDIAPNQLIFITKADTPSANIKKLLDEYKKKYIALSKAITKHNISVSKTEQPLMKVNDMYKSAIAQRGESESEAFQFDEGMIQTGVTFRARCLKAKFWLVILYDWHYVSNRSHVPMAAKTSLRDSIDSELKKIIKETDLIIKECKGMDLPVPQVEARIYRTMFSILDLENQKAKDITVDQATESSIRAQGEAELIKCQAVCDSYPGTLGHIPPVIEGALRIVRGRMIYSPFIFEEEEMIIAEMSAQSQGRQRWFRCINRHLFAVNRGRLTIADFRCPECGERIPIG
ncbi:hypothetical protein TWF694_004090 [Orbilia ellipsospora]|uniref:RZ-type domain-containing protein n=1 Tax=Orbilia ellipsospora TaxID=2528407 RepID=A0AAV9WX00_9PEZI